MAETENKNHAATGDHGTRGEAGECRAVVIREYGVVHLKGALSRDGQRDLWQLIKPHVKDPSGSATGFSCFEISRKGGKSARVPAFDEYGALVFGLCAEQLTQTLDAESCADEPSFRRLHELASGVRKLKLEEVQGNYYRADAALPNHVDCDGILFTMSVALGDDCEFIIGQKTNRSARMSERSGKTQKITMKSGDAIFFDGGSVPHQVKRVLPGTGASWWEEEKVPSGSRCVLLFREQEESFYKRQIKGQGWTK